MPEKQASSWKITVPCTRAEAEALSEDNLFVASSDSVPTIVTREIDPAAPNDWAIDVYCDEEPGKELLDNIAHFAPSTKSEPSVEILGDEDWVTMSQQDLKPLRAGRFYIHTSNSAPMNDPAIRNICIDASQAFGTGHHETTAGCLETLDRLNRKGHHFRNVVDIGTGTGLLAFAAHHLWPQARIVASDIDQIAVDISKDNGLKNEIRLGEAPGRVSIVRSNGLDDIALQRRAPFDLIIANILAGPLVALAPQFGAAAKPGTVIILAGLLVRQKPAVVRALRKVGFRLRHTQLENEWPCLTMVKARQHDLQRKRSRTKSPLAEDYFGEC